MSLQSIPGGIFPIGPSVTSTPQDNISMPDFGLGATLQTAIFIGRVVTSDGGSHTIDTTGSSSLGFRTGFVSVTNVGSIIDVGLAPVDTSNGPPARASNTAGAVNFDVKATLIGGATGLTSDTWQTCVPTSGSKTVANGDLIAFVVAMTVRGGSDLLRVAVESTVNVITNPTVTKYDGSFTRQNFNLPICMITFSDGTIGWIEGGDNVKTFTTRTWNSGSATKEYGQLYQLPFPWRIGGAYGVAAIGNDTDVVLYSDPLGTPVAEKTLTIDANTLGTSSAGLFYDRFSSSYDVAANQPIGIVYKPGASNIATYFKTIANAALRVADPWGTTGYGISRASGAFANANSSLDHYYIGLLASAFEGGSVSTVHPRSGLQAISEGMSR